MKALDIAAFALNAALYVAVGVFFSAVVPLKFGVVRFWPQVIIPATFAAIFGPWVGGLGAAVGIFISDVMLNGDPLLSLMAGVTSNFVCFWLVGYIANKKTRWLIPVVSYSIVTVAIAWIAYVYTDFIYVIIIAAIYAIFLALMLASSKWRSYEVGSIIGLLIGAAIIGCMVPVFAAFFTPAGTTPIADLTLASGFAYFIWTFATEIPFMLVLGPPIIAAIKRAFPRLSRKEEASEQP